ncbi:transmembrane and TPR repeat-containing protein 4-like isoform X2 [Sinocyclocheilus grahami]|uniref:transmembrane and TPR repeat-containing protein 4-like isoform X2 n=1 Tax=Sinocyclocheilus grahami TaxID=75366 RepID=UPI0007ACD690|nr:PREDICTED: transmembrane and TPR repeat-containing protein 4-like isoform X2 [Sinocyclocheilus grahami]
MLLSEPYWDHHIPLPKLGPLHSRLVTAFVALICFINSYDGDFVFDDSEAIINNKDLNPDTPLSNIWKNDFWGSNLNSNSSYKSYRPLTVLTFRINYLLAGGLHPIGFHVLNIALHCVISVLMIDVFAILIGGLVHDGRGVKLNLSPKASFLAALFFAAHPVHTESVSRVGRRDSAGRLCPIVNYNYYYSLNAWLLLCPWWLCFDWSMGCVPLIKSATDWRIVWPLLLWCCLMGLVYQALCSQDSNKRRTLTFGLVLLVIPFLPASNLFFRVGFVIAERVLYISSAGYCLILAYTVGYCSCNWKKHKRLLRAATLTLLCVNVARSAQRSQHWRSEQSLFTSALSVCPLNAKVHYNVGKNLADRGNQSAAIKYYREAVRLHPKYVHAMNNLGNILKERNELKEAEELLSSAVHIQPDFAAAWMNLGIVQNSLKKFDEAEQSYWNAIRFRKKYPDCYYNLGRLYADLNRSIDALNTWRNATMLKPDHSLAWNNMVILLDNTGNLAQAELIGKEALKILPKDHTIMFSLANVLGKQEKYKESEGFFLNALKINPNVASCHGNLAVLYHRWGKLDLAKRHYELSLRLDPSAPGTKENYNMLKRKLKQRQRTVG